MNIIEAIILAIVEGITEFLPISSTGHMIIVSTLMGIEESEFVKMFTVNIQFGAILSVVVLYWRKFFQPIEFKEKLSLKNLAKSFEFYLKLGVAVIPALLLGYLFSDKIDEMLENVIVVAVSLVLGGIVLLFIDKIFNNQVEKKVTYPRAIVIGFFQCLAMVPGVSRSAATIIGGMAQKLTRKTAAEFSFFLAVPTMLAASAYKLLDSYTLINGENIWILLLGNLVAFIVALLAIKFFISYLSKHGFRVFGYYRIILGLIILILYALGIDLKI